MTPEARLDRLERIAKLFVRAGLRYRRDLRELGEKINIMVNTQMQNDERFARNEKRFARNEGWFARNEKRFARNELLAARRGLLSTRKGLPGTRKDSFELKKDWVNFPKKLIEDLLS
jgi:hypothetical protein